MSTASGAPTTPVQIFDDFHFTRNDRVDRTPTTVGDNAAFGDITIGDDCWLWQRSITALQHYFGLLGSAPPAGGVRIKRWSAVFMSAGAAPHTFYDYIVAPTDMASRNAQQAFFHEFGHSLRHVADGARTHWDWDNTRFIYARIHDGDQVTNKGFVFNEGWGNYWSAVVRRTSVAVHRLAPTHASFVDFNEDRVGQRLMVLSNATSPRFMMQVLLENPGIIHTLEQFERRYCAKVGTAPNPHCPPRKVLACPDGYVDDGQTCRLNNITSRPSVGRGVGTTPNACPAGQQEQLGLCYRRCDTGFVGEGPVCWKPCPAGYTDDGVTCRRDAHIFGADNSACPGHDKCGLTFARGCSVCPSGYHNDGCTCRRDAHIFGQESRPRGAGTIPIGCRAGLVYDAGLCYPPCPASMTGVGPMCYGNCPTDSANHGATCYRDPNVFSDDPVVAP
jgi:hypothetical protein